MRNRESLDQIITNLFEPAEVYHRMSVLTRLESGVKGFEVLTKKLVQAADREAFDDLFTEALVATVFLNNGFDVTFLNPPKPDMRVDANHYFLFVEVKRIREDYREAKEIEKKMKQAATEGKLAEYGNVEAGAAKILGVVQAALPQLVKGEINLIFVWTEKSSWEEWEFLQSMEYVEEEICRDHQRYARVSGLIYRTRWIHLTDRRQFYFWQHPEGTMLDEELTRRLENLT